MTPKQDSLGFLVADLARLLRRAFEQRLQGGTLTLAQQARQVGDKETQAVLLWRHVQGTG